MNSLKIASFFVLMVFALSAIPLASATNTQNNIDKQTIIIPVDSSITPISKIDPDKRNMIVDEGSLFNLYLPYIPEKEGMYKYWVGTYDPNYFTLYWDDAHSKVVGEALQVGSKSIMLQLHEYQIGYTGILPSDKIIRTMEYHITIGSDYDSGN